MPYHTVVPLEAITATCEQLYNANGFVKWADVAKIHGLSRQAIHNRLQNATERGDLNPDDLDRWRSMSARAAKSKANEEMRREHEKLRLSMTLTPENKRWLDTECVSRQLRAGDIINGLITKARRQ